MSTQAMQRRHKQSHVFSQVPKAEIPRSSFDRSHGYKTTFDAGLLIPIFVDEALPGDTFNLKMTGFARLATPIFPIMDNMYMETHYFSVPMRLVWDNWQRFNGEQKTPAIARISSFRRWFPGWYWLWDRHAFRLYGHSDWCSGSYSFRTLASRL